MEMKNVLVVCSRLDFILMEKILKEEFLLDRADCREEILYLLEKRKYNLVILDADLIKRDGYFISQLPLSRIPIIALSSESDDARDIRILKAGCVACYIKPFRQPGFLFFVKKCLKM